MESRSIAQRGLNSEPCFFAEKNDQASMHWQGVVPKND
jgi:hypothetical protein